MAKNYDKSARMRVFANYWLFLTKNYKKSKSINSFFISTNFDHNFVLFISHTVDSFFSKYGSRVTILKGSFLFYHIFNQLIHFFQISLSWTFQTLNFFLWIWFNFLISKAILKNLFLKFMASLHLLFIFFLPVYLILLFIIIFQTLH